MCSFCVKPCTGVGGSATTHELFRKDTSLSNWISSTSRQVTQVFWEVRLREARAGKLREEVLERLAVEVLEQLPLEPLEHHNFAIDKALKLSI